MSVCVNCGAPVSGTVYRTTLCSQCGKDLHSCLCCRHYDTSKPYDCSESIQEPISEKGRANFCDFFQINLISPENFKGGKPDSSRSDAAKDAFDALFGD
ncbi:MAG: hypothetical protein PQJ59_01080 [Spirochaetales bacterium]|nr:hypothetical protein [Spirochaetales bacterium]